MLFQLGMNAVLLIVGVVLFVLVKSVLARVLLVIGWLLLIAIANIAFDKLFRKKDANGNILHAYYVSFSKESDRKKAASIMEKYGEVKRKTSRYDLFTTSMTLQQAKNIIRSHLKLSDSDFEIFEGK